MRVTDNMRLSAAIANQSRLAERLYDSTKKASTGLAVEAPSDNPVAYAAVASKDAALARLAKQQEAANRASGDAEIAEAALGEASSLFTRARELAIDMANGDKSAADRAVAAKEVAELRKALITLANARGSRGYLFAGTKTDAAPFSPAGAFTGNDGVIGVDLGGGATLTANQSGAKAFTAAGGRDVIQDLDDLAAAMANDDPAGVQNMLDSLEISQRQVIDARANAGLTVERLRSAVEVADNAQVVLQKARSGLADADAVAAFTELTEARNAYEQSLTVTRQILALASESVK